MSRGNRAVSVGRRALIGPIKSVRIGFTLIEVLVVVAIIAMLIAILLPSLNKARSQAKISACLANLHDLGLALHMYAEENRSFFPPTPYIGTHEPPIGKADHGAGDDNLFVLWYRKYAKDINLFSCPATTYRVRPPEKVELKPAVNGIKYEITTAGQVDLNDFEHIAQDVKYNGFGTSYEYNVWYNKGDDLPRVTWYWDKPADWTPNWPGDKLKTLNLTKPNPAYAFLMHEADEGVEGGVNVIGAPPGTATNNKPEPWDNHGALGMNMQFVDGHVEFIKTHRVHTMWNRQEVK